MQTQNSLFGLGNAGADDRVLVVLQLSGGNDGLNTVVPYEDAEYRRARGRLALAAKDLHQIGQARGLHPSLKGAAQLFKDHKLAIIEGCGYPNPNRSHFKSMDIWHAADPTGRDLRYGWLGRAMDLVSREKTEPSLAINISASSPVALNGVNYKPIAFKDPNAYRYTAAKDVTETFERMSGEDAADNPLLARLRRTADDAVQTSREIRSKAMSYRPIARYPRSSLANSLRTVAGLIKGGLPTRVYYTYHGGFDTHANQAGRHVNLLNQLDGAIVAFQKDLEQQGLADRVVLMAFSEFGRRVRINGSGGTDHGVAGPMFVMGSRVKGGLHGEHPSLTDLNRGDLKHTTDFRSVYATLLDRWLTIDSKRVLGSDFQKLGFLA
jgi:uncharacterized protein (DUF1501 family)